MSAWKVEIKPFGEDFRVHLVVGPQSFIMSSNPAHDMEGAEWMAAQLRHAVEAIERGVLEEAKAVAVNHAETCYDDLCCRPDAPPAWSHANVIERDINDLITTRLPSCSGCAKPDGGTHSAGTKEHP